ncbi:hypothetical protein [Prescottella subtropica]|uniref:hypothetical protein n=1 Tax=Prescottella subtropica TaxID=2545757 RepID=UPI001F4F6EFE|nr:hypothetical protein [Prescottella subtropica]
MNDTSTPSGGIGTAAAAVGKAGLPAWAKKAIWGAVVLAALVIAYFVLAAFLPRWWSQRVASLADGSFGRGITWGLLYGVLCTAVPLLFFYLAWRSRRRAHARIWVLSSVILGVVVAIPNLLTLTVVLGGSSAAHAGERVLDVSAPGFRGASLWGAIIGAALFVGALVLQWRYRKRGEEVTRLRSDLHQREPESSGESPAPEL